MAENCTIIVGTIVVLFVKKDIHGLLKINVNINEFTLKLNRIVIGR